MGYNHQSTITNSYSNGHVSGNSAVGGMVGSSVIGIHNNCYWDIETSGQTTSRGGVGRTTVEMVYPHDENTYVGWDWEIWAADMNHTINDGYPYLSFFNDETPDRPAAVEGLTISILENDVLLTWQPVTETVNGSPIVPDGYIVLFGEDPCGEDSSFFELGFVSETSFQHIQAAQNHRHLFYRIVAVHDPSGK